MIFRKMITAIAKHARLRDGFTLIEVMLCSAILVVATTASLQIYLQTSMLVEHSKEKTVAVSHQKMIMEEIRSWKTLTDDDIITCKSYTSGWNGWLANEVGTGVPSTDPSQNYFSLTGLLDDESVSVSSEDWVKDFTTSPRRVVVKVSWEGVRGDSEMILVGGFF